MRLDELVNEIFNAAYIDAKTKKHEYFTPEHVLYSSLFFDEGKDILESCGANTLRIRNDLEMFLSENIPTAEVDEPVDTLGIHQIMQSTGKHAASCGKEIITLGDIYVAIFDLKESYASYLIQKEGVKRLDILNFISHGIPLYVRERGEKIHTEDMNEDIDYDVFDRDSDEEGEDGEDGREFGGSIIEKFTLDLTAKAREGEIDPLIGREDIINRTMQVLSRRLKNNPIHVGDPGVGKTAITEGLARMIVEGHVPRALKDSKIYCLDMGTLLAGTKYRGDFEERIKNVLNEIKKQEKAIVYIDEIHTVVGAGSVSGGSMDASNILKPFLSDGKLKFIGSTTYEEYKKYFEKDRALSRRFQKIEIIEPTVDETFLILKGLKEQYEKFHNVVFSIESLKVAAELSAKYINDRHLPDKAIDVIDETGAYLRLNAEDDNEVISVTEADIERTVSFIAKVPKKSVASSEVKKLKELDVTLKSEIFGQDKAIETVTRAIKRSRAGLDDGEKPVASLLFVGPTGVGKTELVKQLANSLGIPMIRFDMSEYQEKHTVARLIGSPPGYVGYEEGGLLTDSIRKTPYCVLLLDEIEKAHGDIFNILLQVMDYATLTDNTGKKADFKNVIIIMTSNAGAREMGRSMIGFEERKIDSGSMKKAVDKTFSPEFRNRLDEVVLFNSMDKEMAVLIAKKAVYKFTQKLEAKGVIYEVAEVLYDWLAEKGINSDFGAREILRLVQDEIKTYFVDEILFGALENGGSTVIDIKDDKVNITVNSLKNVKRKEGQKVAKKTQTKKKAAKA
jgi:ATP-dependent Clp protease ATP-binding subunit ClpA